MRSISSRRKGLKFSFDNERRKSVKEMTSVLAILILGYVAVLHPGLGPALQERTSRQLDQGPGLQQGVTWRLGRPASNLSSSLMDHPRRGTLALSAFHSFRQWVKNPFLAFFFYSNT